MESPPPPPLPPQGQQSRETAARWLYEHVLYDLGEQMRINRATIAAANGLNPLAYSQPLPIAAPPQQMPPPVSEATATPAAPPASPSPVDSTPPVNTPAAPAPIVKAPPQPPPSTAPTSPAQPPAFLVDWSVDPKTGKLITSVRPSPNGGG